MVKYPEKKVFYKNPTIIAVIIGEAFLFFGIYLYWKKLSNNTGKNCLDWFAHCLRGNHHGIDIRIDGDSCVQKEISIAILTKIINMLMVYQ